MGHKKSVSSNKQMMGNLMDFYESLDNDVIEQVIKSKDKSKKNKYMV